MTGCPFCDRLAAGRELLAEREHAVAFPDGFPVTDGHALVVPRRHVERVEALRPEEQDDVLRLALEMASAHEAVNVGWNSGAAAGQTVAHAHVHVIPRRAGDVEDPRGGVRWVVPDRADYWS